MRDKPSRPVSPHQSCVRRPPHQTWLIAIIAAAELASSSSKSFCSSTNLILVVAVGVETWVAVVVVVVVVVVQTWADRLNYSNGRDRLRRFHGCPWRADAQKPFVTEVFLWTSFSFTFVSWASVACLWESLKDGKTETFCFSLVSIANTPQENSLLKTSSLLSTSSSRWLYFVKICLGNSVDLIKQTTHKWVTDKSSFF